MEQLELWYFGELSEDVKVNPDQGVCVPQMISWGIRVNSFPQKQSLNIWDVFRCVLHL